MMKGQVGGALYHWVASLPTTDLKQALVCCRLPSCHGLRMLLCVDCCAFHILYLLSDASTLYLILLFRNDSPLYLLVFFFPITTFSSSPIRLSCTLSRCFLTAVLFLCPLLPLLPSEDSWDPGSVVQVDSEKVSDHGGGWR